MKPVPSARDEAIAAGHLTVGGQRLEDPTIPRVLFVTHACYLDSSSGAAIASRAMLEALVRCGWSSEVLCGITLGLDQEVEPLEWLAGQGHNAKIDSDANGLIRLTVGGIPVTIYRGPTTRTHEPAATERTDFLAMLEGVLDRLRPDVMIADGGSRMVREMLARASARGIATVLSLHNLRYRDSSTQADVVIVPSHFAADYYREALGFACTVIPYLVDQDRIRPERPDLAYVTFVNPSREKGAYAFARIASELGRRRPDIPLLVVESRGTEAELAACGAELPLQGTVNFMSHTADPRNFWGVTRICLVPSLGLEAQGLVAMEALANGIPTIASNRGALTETMGQAGIVLPLPDRLTPATQILPTAEEVAPWVDAIIRMWDDEEFASDHHRRGLAEARRWGKKEVEERYVRFFGTLRPGSWSKATTPGRCRSVVLVPHLQGIEWECEQSLRRLEESGVKVMRRAGCSAIDVARNDLMSEALHDGFESMMFIDSDIGFDPQDVFRLLARPEPVVCGLYAKKGRRGLASHFAEGVTEVLFGPDAPGFYPVEFAATGFLRVKATVLRRMIAELELPLCNTKWGRGVWPFFMPTIVPHAGDRLHYLGEDWAFSYRLGLIGVVPLADTSIRLWHWGRYGFGWEDAGSEVKRFRTFSYRLGGR